jgi:tight adherence protein B
LAATISSGLPLVGLSAGLVVAVVASTVGQALDGRSVRARRRQLRSALRMLRAELVAGAREPEALLAASGTETASSAAGIGDRFRRAAVVAGAGGDVAAVFASTGRTGAVERSVSRSVDQDFAPLAAAWHVRSRCGAALADLVGKAENDLMAADERWREADAAMAGPRSSAGLLAGLPLVGLGLGSAMGAHPVGWLLGTTPGAILLLLGVTFDAIGLMWMQRLVRSGFSESR